MKTRQHGEQHYPNFTKEKIDVIIKKLKERGLSVSGNNPWIVDTHNHGIRLHGKLAEDDSTLSVCVADKNYYVPIAKIWKNIDPQIRHISCLTIEEMTL